MASDGRGAWAIVLAGGDGVRLRAMTQWLTGESKPKQFCPLVTDRPLLDDTIRRAALSVPPERHLVILNRDHEAHWDPLLGSTLAAGHLVIQPENRGTAVALWLAVQTLRSLAGDVPVVILPSDHHIADDRLFMAHVDTAIRTTGVCPGSPILMGIEATHPETEYGWIEPNRLTCQGRGPVHLVRRFWEKPDLATARALLGRGCLWNTLVMVGTTGGFLGLMQDTVPDLASIMEPLGTPSPCEVRERWLERVYADLPVLGFSERVLAIRPEACLVMGVRGAGWTDLGSPSRALDVMQRVGRALPAEPEALRAAGAAGTFAGARRSAAPTADARPPRARSAIAR